MRRIMVFTSSRAEYGLLRNTMLRIKESALLRLVIVAAGDHFVPMKGHSADEVLADGFEIDEALVNVLAYDSAAAICRSVGLSTIDLARVFEKHQPDLLLVLGDRYDLLAPATCAVIYRIPVAHIGGGETTEGAIDEQVRHAITKMAHLHFASTWEYAWRIRQMGEQAWRIHVVGAPGVENIRKGDYMTPAEVRERFGIDPSAPTLLITYHPETLTTDIEPAEQVRELINALKEFPDYQQIITYPGTEVGYLGIVEAWKDYASRNRNVKLYASLGSRGYLGVMSFCSAVVGNSSSGIIEAPSFRVPTINIGDRQKGRVRAASIIDVPCQAEAIVEGLNKALRDDGFRARLWDLKNPYDPFGDGNVSARIVSILETVPLGRQLLEKRLDFPDPEERCRFHVG